MYLKQLSIQGFKSFANKTVLEFRPPSGQKKSKGITAIIGPNGSGKSNIADGIRWVLGEQSLKLLRGKKSEDVIFSGSQKASRLSRAEVTITIDNRDRSADIEYQELIITRRLYRNGESEYLLNGIPTPLSSIQLLLAQANVGQKNYAVIGQGMIDTILLASPHERKDFFDEATGIKHYQIKRDSAARTLERTAEHLAETDLLLNETTPRLHLLERQVRRWKQREEYIHTLRDIQTQYYGGMWSALHQELSEKIQRASAVEDELISLKKTQQEQEKEFQLLGTGNGTTEEYEHLLALQRSALSAMREKDNEIIRIQQDIEHQYELKGEGDIAWIHRRLHEIEGEKTTTEQSLIHIKNQTTQSALIMKDTEIERDTILSALTADTHTLEHLQHQNQNTSHHGARQTIETLSHECAILLDELVNNSKKEGLISRVKKIISTLTSVAELLRPHKDTTIEIKNLQKKIKHAHVESEELSAIIQENKMEQKITEQKKSLLREQLDRITREEHALSQKLVIQKTGTKETKITSLTTMGERLKTEYKKYQAEYAKISEQLSTYHFQQHRNKERMLAIQRKSHDINTELSSKEQYVHTILIEQARIEQRSEDIKNEIQQEVPRDIWETIMTPTQEYSLSNEHLTALAEHMITAKKRVNQIGDIEDGIMEEYEEAKQRYDFLSHQSTDLKESHTHLIKIIHELDEKIETQFTHSFKKINEHFNHYFKILFTGGKAALSYRKETKRQKIEERQEDAEETPPNNLQRTIEIDIIACPPNKKITNIGALSGGERSLTSIALLCAIIAANPAPFIVLDEVDAALDEANSERFATILEELSHITQFIAITHNRSTMNKANLLYGVTMNEDASSRLFSVKLEDINEKH